MTAVLVVLLTVAEKFVAWPMVTVAVVGDTDTETLLPGGGGGGPDWVPAPPQPARPKHKHSDSSEIQELRDLIRKPPA